MHEPQIMDMDAAFWVLHYLKGLEVKSTMLSSSSDLYNRGYCDANWGSCLIHHQSVTGYYAFLGSSPIFLETKKHNVVFRSIAKFEYCSMTNLSCELQWLKVLFTDMLLLCIFIVIINQRHTLLRI